MALSETAHRWLLWACVVAVILSLRVGCVLYERSRPFPQKAVVERPIDRDRLVVVPKFYIEDFASAQQLIGKTIWVKLGYATGYFADNPRVKPDNRELRYFQPLESLTIERVMERPIVGEAGNKEVLLHFRREGQAWLTLAGVYEARAERYQMQLDELFYLKNPRELYAHWDENSWSKIERTLAGTWHDTGSSCAFDGLRPPGDDRSGWHSASRVRTKTGRRTRQDSYTVSGWPSEGD